LRRRLATGLLIAIAGLCAGPGVAGARVIHTVLEDDQMSLFSPSELPSFIGTLRWLGVDELRISAEWKLEAPDPDSRSAPRGLDLSDPHTYDGSPAMQGLDRAVRAAAAGGVGVIIDPAFSAPLWGSANPRPRSFAGDPWFNTDINVRELAQWEGMLARRYSGSYVPAGASSPLPRVRTFTLWNEPNQDGYLEPQWGAGHTPLSPDWYRRLVAAAYPAIKQASPQATVLIGNTSPVGGGAQVGNAGVPPLEFIRRLACVTAQLQPITTGSCADFHELPGDGWAQHTYERLEPPWVPSGSDDPDGAVMGDLGKLQALLNRLVALGRFTPPVENVWLTEQGYETNGQLAGKPWTEAQQAYLNAISEYLAWRDPQVQSFAQFLLRDSLTSQTLALRASTGRSLVEVPGTWTTGLERENGQPKPALSMFRSPIVVRPVSTSPVDSWLPGSPAGAADQLMEVWGRVRPARSPTVVNVEVADGGSASSYRAAAAAITDGNGIFNVIVPVSEGTQPQVRFGWVQPHAGWQLSPAVVPVTFPVSGG
jgi:hypothetical protein